MLTDAAVESGLIRAQPMQGNPQSNQQDAPPASLFGGRLPIEAALNELRLRLLDLTGRNRLINFKHTAGKSLQFVHTSLDATFRRLLADQSSRVGITPLPEPDRAAWVTRGGRQPHALHRTEGDERLWFDHPVHKACVPRNFAALALAS